MKIYQAAGITLILATTAALLVADPSLSWDTDAVRPAKRTIESQFVSPSTTPASLVAEDPTNGSVRSVAETLDRFQDQQDEPWNPGHPEYGNYSSMTELQQHAASLARFCLTEDAFVDDCLLWFAGHGEQATEYPLQSTINPEGKVFSELQTKQVNQEIATFDRLVEEAARSSYSFLEACTETYARSYLERVPADAPGPGSIVDESYFRAYTHIRAGEWKYIVHFRSSQFPDLQMALQGVRDLKKERTERICSLIASF